MLLLIALLISQQITSNSGKETSRVTHYNIRPSIPQNDSFSLNDAYYGYSLDERIECGISDNVTTLSLMLLSGIHLINTTRERLLIENIEKVIIAGFQENTIVSCLNWCTFEFTAVKDIVLSNIKIQQLNHNDSMTFTLLVSCSRNFTMRGVTLNPGKIVIRQCEHLPTSSILSH